MRETVSTDELIRRRERQDDYRDRGVVDPIIAGKDDYWAALETQAKAEFEHDCELSDALMPLLYSYQEEHDVSDSAMARALESLAHAWNSLSKWSRER